MWFSKFQSVNRDLSHYAPPFSRSYAGLKEKPLHWAATNTLQLGVWLWPRIDWLISFIHSVVKLSIRIVIRMSIVFGFVDSVWTKIAMPTKTPTVVEAFVLVK